MESLDDLTAQRDLARDAAVALEQELAEVTASRDRAWAVLADIAGVLAPVDREPVPESVDPWGPGIVLPLEWADPEPTAPADPGCICGRPDDAGVLHGAESCCITGCQEPTC